jgi:serine protease
VVVARPAAGTWYLTVVGETAYAGVSVLGSFRAPR